MYPGHITSQAMPTISSTKHTEELPAAKDIISFIMQQRSEMTAINHNVEL